MTARQTTYESPKKGRVLIAEDEELTGQALKNDLAKQDYTVDWLQDYSDCVEALKKNDYHAIVVDIYLNSKEPNGLELIKTARQLGIPSVIVTAALDLEIARNGLNNGADHLLEKPCSAEELSRVLMEIWENPRGLIARRERCLDQHQLTDKEKELCRLMLKGLTNQEVAEVSGSTLGTIKFYSSQIFDKFNVKNRSELFNLVFPT